MSNPTVRLFAIAACVAGISACAAAPGTDTGPQDVVIMDTQRVDSAQMDTVTPMDHVAADVASDMGQPMDVVDTTDGGTPMDVMDVAVADTGVMDGGVADVGEPDTAGASACVLAGGVCVPVVPGACMGGTTGGPSCGTGVGSTCCMYSDAGPPADTGPVTCAAAGGTCVGLSPTSCPPPSTVGDATMFTCGPGIGDECCLPPTMTSSLMPVCMGTTPTNEGWYESDGTLICLATCDGLPAPRCERVGETSQGWYTTRGNGCPPDSQLIIHDPSCVP